MIIMSKAKRVIYVGGICIRPAVNMFNAYESKKLLAARKQLLAIPTMSILDEPKIDEETGAVVSIESIVELTQKDALNVIKKTLDIKTLKKMSDDEAANPKERPKLFVAIQKQIEKVNAKLKTAEDKDAEEDLEDDDE